MFAMKFSLPRFPQLCPFVALGVWLSTGLAADVAGRWVVTDYGAEAEGETLNTVAIRTAIDRGSRRGVVEISAGPFPSGSIF